jgi:putative SOS response-associated peptidase YedK
MCGRYTLTSPDELVEEFGIGELPFALSARYNIAPSQAAPVVVRDHASPEFRLLRWGLVPAWAKLTKSTKRPINARSETVHEKPSFRDAFEHRRCLVCADGFYEWKRQGARPMPFFMHRKDRRPMSLAGIWERHRGDDGTELQTFAILTTEANDLMAPVHHRMPVVIPPEHRARWLDPTLERRDDLEDLLQPPDTENYEIFQVSEKVNSVANDSAACLEPGPDQQSLF